MTVQDLALRIEASERGMGELLFVASTLYRAAIPHLLRQSRIRDFPCRLRRQTQPAKLGG